MERFYTKRRMLYCGFFLGMWRIPYSHPSVALPAIAPYNPKPQMNADERGVTRRAHRVDEPRMKE